MFLCENAFSEKLANSLDFSSIHTVIQYNSTTYMYGEGERESGNRKRRRETKLYKKIINNCITYIFPLVPLQNLAQSDRKDDIIVRSSLLITALGSIFTILVVYL